VIPSNDFTRFRPIADITECELIFGTPPVDIARVLHFNDVDNLVGFLSRCGYNGTATALYDAAHRETA
jgi:hypothetical protein